MLTPKMNLLVERGLFESEESLTTSAYRSLLTLQPELKLEIALSLYEREEISLGRAAEISGYSHNAHSGRPSAQSLPGEGLWHA